MRIALTRPAPESDALARRLAAAGHDAVVVPVMAIAPLAVDLPAAGIDAVVLTSRHATAGLTPAQRERLAPLPALAVGAASAAAARAAGFKDVRTAGADAAALRDLARLTLPHGHRVLYLAGIVHKPALPDALRGDGRSVTVLPTYDAVPVAWDATTVEALRAAPPDAWLHFSARSAALAAEQMTGAGLGDAFREAAHLCLSADVASSLHRVGAAKVTIADRPTCESLVQAVSQILTTPAE